MPKSRKISRKASRRVARKSSRRVSRKVAKKSARRGYRMNASATYRANALSPSYGMTASYKMSPRKIRQNLEQLLDSDESSRFGNSRFFKNAVIDMHEDAEKEQNPRKKKKKVRKFWRHANMLHREE